MQHPLLVLGCHDLMTRHADFLQRGCPKSHSRLRSMLWLQAATPGDAGGNEEMPAQDAMDVDMPAPGVDLAEAITGTGYTTAKPGQA